MAKSKTSNPCATEERTYKSSLKRVEAADEAHTKAWEAFRRDPVANAIPQTDFIVIRNALTVGRWPSESLSMFSNVSDTTLVSCARAVYEARKKLDHWRDMAEEDRVTWIECMREHGCDGSGGSSGSGLRCGKPCVGHGREDKLCQVRLGEDGKCQYHG